MKCLHKIYNDKRRLLETSSQICKELFLVSLLVQKVSTFWAFCTWLAFSLFFFFLHKHFRRCQFQVSKSNFLITLHKLWETIKLQNTSFNTWYRHETHSIYMKFQNQHQETIFTQNSFPSSSFPSWTVLIRRQKILHYVFPLLL